ncbi:uncharacterized protein LOC110482608 [Lonchura striata]
MAPPRAGGRAAASAPPAGTSGPVGSRLSAGLLFRCRGCALRSTALCKRRLGHPFRDRAGIQSRFSPIPCSGVTQGAFRRSRGAAAVTRLSALASEHGQSVRPKEPSVLRRMLTKKQEPGDGRKFPAGKADFLHTRGGFLSPDATR